ncbi:unnamed protein product [Cylindrotheca closterium]|uniref:Uncharacterized protein n=1 Tax=Cylindrotheca closterium TaxID=2856 RepID=A0AAD2JIU9_9STRA|nr:unnamed protein product [Cylindrotheca closterium]
MSTNPLTTAAAAAAAGSSSSSTPTTSRTAMNATQTQQTATTSKTRTYQHSYPVVPPPPPTRQERSRAAYDEVVQALSVDMPLIMHASGDPGEADPDSVRLLSELTANYIGNLVHAAMDAHAMMHQGHQALPPPPFERVKRRFPPTSETGSSAPYPSLTPEDAAKSGSAAAANATDATTSTSTDRKEAKRRRITGDLFDEPLPEPKIKKPTSANSANEADDEEWVGVQGVDLHESSRTRTAYTAEAISTAAFIFPICHDPGLYGRVMEVQQTARRSVAPLLVDPIVQAVVAEEGKEMGRRIIKAPKKKKKEAVPEGEENEEDEDEEHDTEALEEREQVQGATWPGLESLLPVHVTADFKSEGE